MLLLLNLFRLLQKIDEMLDNPRILQLLNTLNKFNNTWTLTSDLYVLFF